MLCNRICQRARIGFFVTGGRSPAFQRWSSAFRGCFRSQHSGDGGDGHYCAAKALPYREITPIFGSSVINSLTIIG
jgi:hypothetical protein